MPNGLIHELKELKPPSAAPLNARDVSARRAPIIDEPIRWETIPGVARAHGAW